MGVRTRAVGFSLVVIVLVSSFAVQAPVATGRPARGASGPPSVPTAGATPAAPAALRAADGTTSVVSEPNDWSWERWSTGVGPSPRFQPTLVDDPAEHGVLLFGGTSLATSAILNDTWLFRAGSWTELCSGTSAPPTCPSSPSPRVASEAAYDPVRSAVVLFSGAKSFSDPDDTWLFVNGSWTNVTTSRAPPPGDSLPVATSPNGTVALIALSNDGAETWEFGASGWAEVSTVTTPSVSDLQPMWFDANLGVDVLWDQASGTWEFDGRQWTLVPQTASPPTTGGLPEGAAFDSSFGYGVLYAPTAKAPTTWAFAHGAWSNVTANVSLGPPTTNPIGIAYDSTDGYIVAVEDTGPRTADISTWLLHDPFTLRLNDTWPVRDVGQATYFGITVSGGIAPYGVTVQNEPDGCGPPSNLSNRSTIECVLTNPGRPSLGAYVHDSRFLYLNASLGLVVAPTLGASAQATPNPTVVGHSVDFSAAVAGGATPYNITWQIPGRGSRSGAATTAVFGGAGDYEVNLTVSDSALASWSVTFPVDVLNALGLRAGANTTATDVGYPVGFAALETGGLLASPVNWTFGDGDSGAGANVTHAYKTSGNFSVEASAVDVLGESVAAPVSVTVHAKLTAHPGPLGSAIPVAGSPAPLTAGIAGGTPPFVVAWTWNGGGSTGATPSPTFGPSGPLAVEVTVRDAVGASAVGFANLSVEPATASGPAHGSSAPDTGGEAEVAAVLVVGAAVAALVWSIRRRRASA